MRIIKWSWELRLDKYNFMPTKLPCLCFLHAWSDHVGFCICISTSHWYTLFMSIRIRLCIDSYDLKKILLSISEIFGYTGRFDIRFKIWVISLLYITKAKHYVYHLTENRTSVWERAAPLQLRLQRSRAGRPPDAPVRYMHVQGGGAPGQVQDTHWRK